MKSSAAAGGFRSHQKSNSVLNTPSPTKPLGRGALAHKSPFEEATPVQVESSQKFSEHQAKIISEQKLQIEKVKTSESRNDLNGSPFRSATMQEYSETPLQYTSERDGLDSLSDSIGVSQNAASPIGNRLSPEKDGSP